MAEPYTYKPLKLSELSTEGKKTYTSFDKAILGAAANINGQKTGITMAADFERVLMDMAGIKGITEIYPESVTTAPTDKEAKKQSIKIEGMKQQDVTAFVKNFNEKYKTTLEEKAFNKETGVAIVQFDTAEIVKIAPKIKEYYEELGKKNPGMIRVLQKQSKVEQAFKNAAEMEKSAKELDPNGYAKQLKQVIGTDVTVTERKTLTEKSTMLVINIGNGEVADEAINDLVPLRTRAFGSKEAGKEALPFAFDEDKGLIMIPLKAIEEYEAKNGAGSLVKKLADVKSDFSKVIKTAKDKADEIEKMPSYEPKATIKFNNAKYEEKPLVIENGDFNLPESVKKAAL